MQLIIIAIKSVATNFGKETSDDQVQDAARRRCHPRSRHGPRLGPGKGCHPVKSVVLVHGGFVDGSGWMDVYKILKKDGYDVTIVQNPTNALADDVAVTRRAIAAAKGQVILVGHSYGGVVVSEAGTDPKVAGVVYIAAFAPDKGESVSSLIANPAPGAPVPPILPPQDGYLFLDKARFAAAFAADVKPDVAGFMADSQVPWGSRRCRVRSPPRPGG